MLRTLIVALALFSVQRVTAQGSVRIIDFNDPPEGTILTDQYVGQGVTFESTGATPVIARAGQPRLAFSTNQGTFDSPVPSSPGSLTDDPTGPAGPIPISFTPPVNSVSFFIVDIDLGETYTVEYLGSGGTLMHTETVSAGAAGTGDGVATRFGHSAPGITGITIHVPPPGPSTGWALDDLTFTRGPSSSPFPINPTTYLVEEETSPGSGAYTQAGYINAFRTNATPEVFYGYGNLAPDSFYNDAIIPSPDGSCSFLTVGPSGISAFWVHDAPMNGTPGRAETRIRIPQSGAGSDPDGAVIGVRDDPVTLGDSYTSDVTGHLFTATQTWGGCCTDGWAVDRIHPDATIELTFTDTDANPATPAFSGLNTWEFLSADGPSVRVTLETDRKTRLTPTGSSMNLSMYVIGSLAYVDVTGVTPGHEVVVVPSFEPAPGGPGSGPYLGLYATNPVSLFAPLFQPLGTPLHFIATTPTTTIGPFPAPPAGTVIEGGAGAFNGQLFPVQILASVISYGG